MKNRVLKYKEFFTGYVTTTEVKYLYSCSWTPHEKEYLNSALNGGEWSVSRSGRLVPGERGCGKLLQLFRKGPMPTGKGKTQFYVIIEGVRAVNSEILF
jgi:hypothetical protein